MATVILVIHIMVAIALVGSVLLQRSEGGALGIGGGGGGGGGGFLSGRGAANMLTRTTAVLALAFFATSISLTLIARAPEGTGTIINSTSQPAGTTTAPALPAPAEPAEPQAPVSQ